MDDTVVRERLEKSGKITWLASEQGSIGDPEDVVRAPSDGGFEEYRREIASTRRDTETAGGL